LRCFGRERDRGLQFLPVRREQIQKSAGQRQELNEDRADDCKDSHVERPHVWAADGRPREGRCDETHRAERNRCKEMSAAERGKRPEQQRDEQRRGVPIAA
jgi:hypothetical protein